MYQDIWNFTWQLHHNNGCLDWFTTMLPAQRYVAHIKRSPNWSSTSVIMTQLTNMKCQYLIWLTPSVCGRYSSFWPQLTFNERHEECLGKANTAFPSWSPYSKPRFMWGHAVCSSVCTFYFFCAERFVLRPSYFKGSSYHNIYVISSFILWYCFFFL